MNRTQTQANRPAVTSSLRALAAVAGALALLAGCATHNTVSDGEDRNLMLKGHDPVAYTYVLVDCPPSLGTLTLNGLVAATEVLAPVQCEYLALEGLTQLLGTLRRVRDRLNPDLRRLHLAMTMFEDGKTPLMEKVKSSESKVSGDLV